METLKAAVINELEKGTNGIAIYELLIDTDEAMEMVTIICSELLLTYKNNRGALVIITQLLTATHIDF